MLNRHLLHPHTEDSIKADAKQNCKRARILLWLAPLVTSVAETCEVAVEIENLNGTKLLELIEPTTAAAYIIVGGYLVQAIALNGPATIHGINETCEILKTHQLPENWPQLSKGKEVCAVMLTSVCTSYAAFADCVSIAYFISSLGGNDIAAYATGIMASLTNIFCEGSKVYETTRKIMAGTSREYQTNISRCITPIVGYPLAFISGLQDALWSYSPLIAKFQITSSSTKWVFFSSSMLNGVSDMCFNGGTNLEALDGFIARLAQGECIDFNEIFAFTASVFLSATVSDLSRRLTVTFLLSPETALPFTLSVYLIELLAWSGAISQGINFAYSTYTPIHKLTQMTTNSIKSVFHWCYTHCNTDPPTPTTSTQSEAKPSSPQNRYRLFQPSSPPVKTPENHIVIEPEQDDLLTNIETPRESCCTRLMKYLKL